MKGLAVGSSLVIRKLEGFFSRYRAIRSFIMPARFPLIITVIVSLVWLSVPQGQEILRALAEPAVNRKGVEPGKDTGWLQLDWGMLFGFVLFLLLLSFQCWGWSRLSLAYRFAGNPQRLTASQHRAERDVPNICGAFPIIATGAGFLLNAFKFPGPSIVWFLAAVGCGLLLPFLVILCKSDKSDLLRITSGGWGFWQNLVLLATAVGATAIGLKENPGAHTYIGVSLLWLAWLIYGVEWSWSILLVALGAVTAGVVEGRDHDKQWVEAVDCFIAAVVLGALFYLFRSWRRKEYNLRSPLATKRPGYRLQAPLRLLLFLRMNKRNGRARSGPLRRAMALTRLLFAMFLMNLAGLITFSVCGPEFCWWMTTGSILWVGFATWVAIGSAAVIGLRRRRLPIASGLVVVAVGVSALRDHHPVRLVEQPASGAAVYEGVEPALLDWNDKVKPSRDLASGARVPCFIVVAEGGGIRAAYWTAEVLGRLQERSLNEAGRPDFLSHCFAISGVSGGSLGAGLFCAIASDPKCWKHTAESGGKSPMAITHAAHSILAEDHLSAPVARGMFPELPAMFAFRPIKSIDRGYALERSWEASFATLCRSEIGNNYLSNPFLDFWAVRPDRPSWLPLLLLNSTLVEDGSRVIFSNLRIREGDKVFCDAVGGHELLRKEGAGSSSSEGISRDLPFSTAIHNSARFPYISPAGRLPGGKCLTDGGLFENSGATTALDLYQEMLRVIESKDLPIEPVIIVIRFGGKAKDRERADGKSGNGQVTGRGELVKPKWIGHCMSEVLAPPLALMNTRGARGNYAIEALKKHAIHRNSLSEPMIVFTLEEHEDSLPLGWMLSGRATQSMIRQMPYVPPASAAEHDKEQPSRTINATAAAKVTEFLLQGVPSLVDQEPVTGD